MGKLPKKEVVYPKREIGIDRLQTLVAANCINVLQAGAIGKLDQLP